MLPSIISRSHLSTPYYDLLLIAQLLLVLVVGARRLRGLPWPQRRSPVAPLRRVGEQPLLLQEERVALTKQPPRFSACAHALFATKAPCCALLVARSAVLLHLDPSCAALAVDGAADAGSSCCARSSSALNTRRARAISSL